MNRLTQDYLRIVTALLERIAEDRDGSLAAATRAVADALGRDRIIYVAGSGHSQMLAEEVFYRAGGIAAAQPLWEPDLMLHLGARAASAAERREGIAAAVIARYPVGPGDVVVIVSNSGRNAFPVELALAARAAGATTIALTSLATAAEVTSRHGSGKLLCDLADIVIDNHVPTGDAALAIPAGGPTMGPVSTLAGVFILNAVLAEAVARLAALGIAVDVYQSANGPNESRTTPAIADRWKSRISPL